MSNVHLQRKSSLRLREFDYKTSGYYFITICTFDRKPRFGEISNKKIILNSAGRIIEKAWRDLPNHYPNLQLDEFIIMPNHFHAIAILNGKDENPARDVSEIVRGFKTWSARRINRFQGIVGPPLWQRSFHDHVIRDDKGHSFGIRIPAD